MLEFIKPKTVTVMIKDTVYDEVVQFTFDDVVRVIIEDDKVNMGDYKYHLYTTSGHHHKVYGYTLLVH